MNGLSLNLISHPGETLLELLEINAMTQKELAVDFLVPQSMLTKLLRVLNL